MNKILVVEDDERLNKIVCSHLRNSHFDSVGCLNVRDAYEKMYKITFDLIITDIMMPDIDGFEFAEAVRRINQDIPILFMSARDDFSAKQKGFQAGIDDYIVKPVDLNELVLRINAQLRRSRIANEHKIQIGDFLMDLNDYTVSLSGEELMLTHREFQILFKLLSYPKHIFSRAQLMDEFWDVDTDATLRAVDVYIAKLRDKLSACSDFKIVTVRGIGYKAVIV